MKKSRGILTVLLVIAMIIVIMAGCATNNAGKSTSTQQDTSSAVNAASSEQTVSSSEQMGEDTSMSGEVTVWTWFGDQITQSIVPEFNKMYPNIKVNSINVPGNEFKTKFMSAVAAGSGAPDVSAVQDNEIKQYIENGGLFDLTEKIQSHINDFPKYKMDLLTAADGKIYGVPMDAGPCALFYRQDLFEKAGVSVPKTWEEWFNDAVKFREAGLYLHRTTAPNGDVELLRMLLQQMGSGFFDKDGKVTINTPEMKKALQFEVDVAKSGKFMEVANWSPAYDVAMQGNELASHVGAAWYMNVFMSQWPNASDQWRIAPMPYFDGYPSASANQGGSNFVIPDQGKNKDVAWAFVSFYTLTTDGRIAETEGLGEFPCYYPSFENERINGGTKKFFGDQQVYKFFFDELQKVPANFYQPPAFNEMVDMIVANIAPAISGEATVDKVLADTQKQAEQAMEKYK